MSPLDTQTQDNKEMLHNIKEEKRTQQVANLYKVLILKTHMSLKTYNLNNSNIEAKKMLISLNMYLHFYFVVI